MHASLIHDFVLVLNSWRSSADPTNDLANEVSITFKAVINMYTYKQIRVSIVVSIPACHAGDPGSIPGLGVLFFVLRGTQSTRAKYIRVGHPSRRGSSFCECSALLAVSASLFQCRDFCVSASRPERLVWS